MPNQKNSTKNTKIALIGGGTGSFTLLQEVKNITSNISAIVNMSDDGGSTGRLRDELGVLPPGDIRQCLVALSNTPNMRDVFNYRFGEGALAGHSLGNLILSGLELQYNDFAKAIEVASSVLNITGKVIPITLEKHDLLLADGSKVIRGEYKIGNGKISSPNAKLRLDPNVSINPAARAAILKADLVVIAPGNLYGSLLPALIVRGVSEAIANTNALVVMVANLVNKPGQTDGWNVTDYVKKIEEYVGLNTVDVVLYNNKKPAKELLDKYTSHGEYPVEVDTNNLKNAQIKYVGADLIAGEIYQQDKNDKAIPRTLIRHNAKAVSIQLRKLLDQRSKDL